MIDWFKPLDGLDQVEDQGLVEMDRRLGGHINAVRWASRVTLLLIVVGMFMSMKSRVENIDGDAVAKAAEARVATILPRLQTAAMEVGEEVAPHVATAFEKEAATLTDDLQVAMDKETTQMREGLPTRMEGALLKEMGKVREEQRALLMTRFPAFKQDPEKLDKLFEAFEAGTAKWAGLVLVRLFEKHLDELLQLRETLNKFVASKQQQDANAGQGQEAIDGEQVLNLWLELLGESIGAEGGDIIPDQLGTP